MIRVNLARSKKRNDASAASVVHDSSSPEKEIQKQGSIKLLVIILFPLALYLYESNRIPELNATLQTKRNLLSSLTEKNEQAKQAVTEIAKFKEDQTKLQQQIDSIENLKKGRMLPVRILDLIQRVIPTKVWLSRLDFTPDGTITMQGFASSNTIVDRFMKNLGRSVFLKDIHLVRTEDFFEEGTGSVKRFEISCAMETPQ